MLFNVKVGVFVSWQKCTASGSQGYDINVLRSQKRDLYVIVPVIERERERERERFRRKEMNITLLVSRVT
jgi:hypothetical protein